MKALVAKIFGFDAEINTYKSKIEAQKQQIKALSWDAVFNMWTRNAFLQFCSVMPRGKRVVVFLDLDDMHDLNHRYGYPEMDKRIRAVFSIPFRRSDIVARWYSGDEIVILFDADVAGAKHKMDELAQSARRQEMSFQYEMSVWDVSETPIIDMVNMLAKKLSCKMTDS